MSEADNLLNSLNAEEILAQTADPDTEPHIIVGADRFIVVPDELKRVAVQYDHNIETVTFDCIRYWDGYDMSKMHVYINYMTASNTLGQYLCDNVTVDENDSNIMHFDWTISHNVTIKDGGLVFLVCVKRVDEAGNEELHWNSERNNEMYISPGLENGTIIIDEYPDIITQLLARMDRVEGAEIVVTGEQILALQRKDGELEADIKELEKLTTFVTPEMFGAVGDGVTDDSDAIQAMVDHGGMAFCVGRYLIKKDINLRDTSLENDTHVYPRTTVYGRTGVINQLDSSATTAYLSHVQATFIFEGGSFLVKHTSQVEFVNCVFMGSLNADTMTQTAFKMDGAPFRKLHVRHSTFVNLAYGVYGVSEAGTWCGEHVFDDLYFALCDYCIYMQNGGLDSRFSNCIVQGTCNNFLYLTNASGAMITKNHDYSKHGSVLYGAFIFTSNYSDGLDKLAVWGGSSDRGTTVGPTITGNLFMGSSVATGTMYAIKVISMLMGATICGNTFMGGQAGKIILLDTSEATYVQHNKIFANSGRIDAYVNDSTASKYYYGNDIDNVGFEYLTPCGPASNVSWISCNDGATGFAKIPSPKSLATGIVVQLNGMPCRVLSEMTVVHTDGTISHDLVYGNVISTEKYSNVSYIIVKSNVKFGMAEQWNIPFYAAP